MMTSPNSAVAGKRDLHVGGVGSTASAAFASNVDPFIDSAASLPEALLEKARDAFQAADDAVRDNPWAVIGVTALASLAAGYFLSRRS